MTRNKKAIKPKDKSFDAPIDNGTFENDREELRRIANPSIESTEMRGSDSISGSNPNVHSDDDVLENHNQKGIAPYADLEHPTELNLAKDINDAENPRRASIIRS
jgi:hypothetical protein